MTIRRKAIRPRKKSGQREIHSICLASNLRGKSRRRVHRVRAPRIPIVPAVEAGIVRDLAAATSPAMVHVMVAINPVMARVVINHDMAVVTNHPTVVVVRAKEVVLLIDPLEIVLLTEAVEIVRDLVAATSLAMAQVEINPVTALETNLLTAVVVRVKGVVLHIVPLVTGQLMEVAEIVHDLAAVTSPAMVHVMAAINRVMAVVEIVRDLVVETNPVMAQEQTGRGLAEVIDRRVPMAIGISNRRRVSNPRFHPRSANSFRSSMRKVVIANRAS